MSRYVFSRFECHMFYFLYPFMIYLLTLPHVINKDTSIVNVKKYFLSMKQYKTSGGNYENVT
jgi:hypothetical protein